MKLVNFLLIISLFFSCNLFSSKKDNTLNLILTDQISSLDPAIAYDLNSGKIIYQVYETLYQYHYLKRPYALTPLIASDFPTYKKGKTRLVIPIKKGIYYHASPCFNGVKREVIAQDFVNQIKRLIFSPVKSSGEWIILKKIKGAKEFKVKAQNDLNLFFTLNVSGLSVIDRYTFSIELNEPDPSFINILAMSHIVPIPEEAIRYYKNDFSANLVGTGPYYLSEFSESKIVLKKNKDYITSTYPQEGDRLAHTKNLLHKAGKKLPFIDEINFTFFNSTNEAFDLFMENKIDLLERIPISKYHDIFDKNGNITKNFIQQKIKVTLAPTLTFWWVAFNMQNKILGANLNLRKAIAHAINRTEILKKFTHNTGLTANSIYPPGILGYDPKSEFTFSYDPEKAKIYLQKAGFPNGQNLPTLKFDLRNPSEESIKQANIIKEQLAKIGIKIEILINTFPEFLIKNRKSKTEIWLGGWSLDFPDPLNVLQLLSKNNFPPGPNKSFYYNPVVEKKIQEYSYIEATEDKKKLLDEIQQTAMNDFVWIPLFFERYYILYHNDLINYRYSDLVFNNLKYLQKN